MFCNTFLTSWRPPGKLGGLWSSWPSSLAVRVAAAVRQAIVISSTHGAQIRKCDGGGGGGSGKERTKASLAGGIKLNSWGTRKYSSSHTILGTN